MQYSIEKKDSLSMEIKNIFLDEVDSTQLWTQQHYHLLDPYNISCITANYQTKGFGRYNRPWVCPKGQSITSTFYFRINVGFHGLHFLSQLLCISLTKILIYEELIPLIKWPNDILINEKKIAGVLCQTIFEKEFIHVFLGVGINVNIEPNVLKEIDQPATSLYIETKKLWDKTAVLQKLQEQFLQDFNLFLKEGFAPFLKVINDLLFCKGQKTKIFDGINSYEGIVDRVSEEGGLKLILNNGSTKIFQSGDIYRLR